MLEFDPAGLTIADLIGIPYKDKGRSLNGLDCYGLSIAAVLILTGKTLKDVVYENHAAELSNLLAPTLNVRKTTEIKRGNLIEMTFKNELHIGVIINNRQFIHSTYDDGVRINNLRNAPILNIYEVL